MSLRSPKRTRSDREGFQSIPPEEQENMARNDARIDIPMEQGPNSSGSDAGLRNQSSMTPLRQTTSYDSPNEGKRDWVNRRRLQSHVGRKTGHVDYDGEEDTINTMGKIYKKMADFSIITRYVLYIMPLGALIAIPIIIGATASKRAEIGGVRILWFFVWVEVVWASLWISKIVAHLLPMLFEILVGFVSSGVRKYSMVLRALEIPLSLVGWAVTALATFMPIMTKNPDVPDITPRKWENILQKILAAATICSLVYLGEKFIIQLISIDYHRKQFHFRIKASKRSIYLLGLLYDASRSLFPTYCNEFAEEDYIIADQLESVLGLGSKDRSHRRSGSRTPMRMLQDIGRYGDKLTSVFGNVAHEVTGKQIFDPTGAHSIVVQALERPRSSEALAKRIWMSFVVEGREALFQDDFLDVLGPDRTTESEEAFAVIDKDGNGDISLDEMIMAVSELGRERKSISTSMHDVDQAINVLDNLFGTVVSIAVIFIFVAFLNENFVTTLATTGTALLSLSFVFAGTCQEVLGSCIFVFVKHPYDVGDRIDLSTDQFTVEHISLLFTVFRRISGANIGRSVQIPNIVLNSLWVENVSRSKQMSEQLEIDISFDTTFDDIQILRNELKGFITDKENSRDFLPEVEVGILGASDQSKLQLQVEIKHKSNWANESVRQARRSKFMCALVSALKTVPIYPPGGGGYAQGSAANPAYSVAISDEMAKKNAEESAKAKEGLRLVPTKKIKDAKNAVSSTSSGSSGAAGLSEHDNKIVEDLTSRHPATDPARDRTWTSSREDDSTLGRPSVDRQDLDQMRTMLRRESTRGKRKPSSEVPRLQRPSIPTISERGNTSSTDYAHSAYCNQNSGSGTNGYHNSGYSSMPTAYRPMLSTQRTQYQSASSQLPQVAPTSPLEMRSVSRNPSNPYRKRSESINRKPLSPTAGEGERDKEEFENTRPYSGV